MQPIIIEMKLSITGNAEFFQEPLKGKKNILSETLLIDGTLKNDYDNSFLKVKIKEISSLISGKKILDLSQKIRNSDFEKVNQLLSEYGIGDNKYWNENLQTYQELGMIKSLFNTFLWVESFFSDFFDKNEMNIEKNIYNEVILDYGASEGTVEDMYLLPKEYREEKWVKEINHLMEINLLCRIDIKLNEIDYRTYFIPFVKPGVQRDKYFIDKKIDTYPLWNMLLRHRNNRLKELFS